MAAKSLRPLAIDSTPPGASSEGAGGARKRAKKANFSIALIPSTSVLASVWVTSLGTSENWQLGVSSRSVWNSSLVIPISTLYASPENNRSDLFWAFHPNRATVPSLPLLFAWPEIAWPARTILGRPAILSAFFLGMSLAWFARIAWSGICSIRPAPNTGVGIRKITLRCAISFSKSGCTSMHPGASERPVMVNRSWTPPSGVPSGFLTNLASRTGPFAVMNDRTELAAPFRVANATWGFTGGLVPPTAGCKWQPAQLPRFIVGPRPSATSSSSTNSSVPALKKTSSVLVSPARGAPAPAAPPRTPGSRAVDDESTGGGISAQEKKKPTTASVRSKGTTIVFIATPSSPVNRTRRDARATCVLYSHLRSVTCQLAKHDSVISFSVRGNGFNTILIAVMTIPVGTLRKLVLTSDLMTYLSHEHAERFYFFRIGLVHRCVRGGRFSV